MGLVDKTTYLRRVIETVRTGLPMSDSRSQHARWLAGWGVAVDELSIGDDGTLQILFQLEDFPGKQFGIRQHVWEALDDLVDLHTREDATEIRSRPELLGSLLLSWFEETVAADLLLDLNKSWPANSVNWVGSAQSGDSDSG
jgi:hypothetical protein